jgi:hypothetical protein
MAGVCLRSQYKGKVLSIKKNSMISIFAPTELHPLIRGIIDTEDRLNELIVLYGAGETPRLSAACIKVDMDRIRVYPDWYDLQPPVIFPTLIPFSKERLLGIIFVRLGNADKARQYLQGYPELLFCAESLFCLQRQEPFPEELAMRPGAYRDEAAASHNHAVCLHYGGPDDRAGFENLASLYEQALMRSDDPDTKAFTAKHYATLLIDAGQSENAEAVIREVSTPGLHEDSIHGLSMVQCQSWLNRLAVPYDEDLLSRLKQRMWEDLQYLENKGRRTEEALLLLDAAHIANISNSFSESLGYVNKAISIFREEGEEAFIAHASLKKGILLYTWAQNGNPQFYRGAKDALLTALGYFTREEAPDVFADIHQYLGIIYSEIPDEVKKKSVWAAVSVSSFQEALAYYNKVDFPYEFGMICHHFGNAYTKYPAAVHSDNYDKALSWYREALDVRTADSYPVERSHTLSNYLDASWKAANPDESLNTERFDDMCRKAAELAQLAPREELKKEAEEHLKALRDLKVQYAGQ